MNVMNSLLKSARIPNQVIFCQYKSNAQLKRDRSPRGHSPFYVHSKTWVFDDELLISGSANFNRRGYSHDLELDFSICSPTTDFVQKTRIRLWRQRLFTEGFKGASPPSDTDLADFDSACRYWLQPSTYTEDIESSAEVSVAPFQPVYHPDATSAEIQVDLTYLLQLPVHTSIMWKISLYVLLWDVVVDPDGT